MSKDKLTVILSWTAVFIWLIVIFSFSAQPAVESGRLSRKVTEVIIEKAAAVLPLDGETSTTADLVARFNHVVRKCGHFGIYFVLGVLVTNAFNKSRITGLRGFIFSLMFCILYAITDEVHQMFVPGRGPQVTDVMLDSLGALTGIGTYRAFKKLITGT